MVQPQAIHMHTAPAMLDPVRPATRHAACEECNDTGHVWIVCPDAGAVTVPCACRGSAIPTKHGGSLMLDVALAGAFVSGCGALLMLL